MSQVLFDNVFGKLQQALDLRLPQHGLVSSNVANADTPGYKAQRIDFKRAFAEVWGETGADSVETRTADSRHIVEQSDGMFPVVELEPQTWSENGNSVNPEEEMVVLAENNLLFNATVEVLNRRLALLEYAASDGGK